MNLVELFAILVIVNPLSLFRSRMAFDILITGGTIIDGTGRPQFKGDVGISGGRIHDVSESSLAGAKAEEIIDATDKFVVPGFIDITSQAEKNWSLFQNPGQDYLLTQGVTSILIGNCGSSLAPFASPEAIESLRKWTHDHEANVNWLSVGEFLSELSRHHLGLNVGTLVGHGTIRRGILKDQVRPMSPEELTEFGAVIERGMQEGAFGLSTGLVYSHEAPATIEELSLLAKVVARAAGIYKTHLRHEGRDLAPAVNEAIQIGRESGVNVIVSHIKAIGRKTWPHFAHVLSMIEHANENGAFFHYDISPYRRTGSFLYLLLPTWARAKGFKVMLDLITAPESRAKIIEDIKKYTLHFDRYIIANSASAGSNGKTLAEISAHTGSSPEEALLNLLAANDGRVVVFGRTLSYRNLEVGIKHPLAIIASDGNGVSEDLGKSGILVHPRSTGTFPHFLHRFVKERALMTWEEGIRKITSAPAELIGFKERGRIAKGFYADLVVFNPETIHDRSTYHNPYVHPIGIDSVLVNGKLAVDGGALTGAAAGEMLKKS